MRIAHVIPDAVGGGAERVATNLVSEMAGYGHDTVLVHRVATNKPHRVGFSGADVALASLGPLLRPLRLRRFLEFWEPDVVNCHTPWAGIHAVHFRQIPFVYTLHSPLHRKPFHLRVVELLAICRSRATIAVSTEAEASIPQLVGASRPHTVIHNGTPHVRTAASPTDHASAIWIGRFVPSKRPADFIDAVVRSGAAGIMIGDGPLKRVLAVRQLQVPNLCMRPWQSDLDRTFRSARCVVLTSEHEGLPMVAIEAMSYGLPVIATDIASHRTVLGTETQTLYPVGDVASLARLIGGLAQDNTFVASEGRRLRDRHCRLFSLARSAESYLAMYEKVRCQ